MPLNGHSKIHNAKNKFYTTEGHGQTDLFEDLGECPLICISVQILLLCEAMNQLIFSSTLNLVKLYTKTTFFLPFEFSF